jgi:hypothetical protein
MKLLIVSATGYGLGLASHLASDGHAVNLVITHDECVNIVGKGIITSSTPSRPDITVFDHHNFGKSADELRQEGARVFGASVWSQMLQDDPEYRQAVIRATWGNLEPVKKGVEAYITCWFNGNSYVATYLSLVYHRINPGGTAVDVGFTGCLSNFWQPTQRVRDCFLEPLLKVLRRANHRGCFHIRSTIDGDKFSISDIAASFEHPLSLVMFENSKATIPDILLRMFNEDSMPIQPLDQWACSVLLSVPPYPYTIHHPPAVLGGIVPANLKHLWLVDAMREDGKWMTTGTHGKVGYVTARGTTFVEASRRAYRTIRNLQVQDLQYRPDVGKGVNTFLSSLRNYGWIK